MNDCHKCGNTPEGKQRICTQCGAKLLGDRQQKKSYIKPWTKKTKIIVGSLIVVIMLLVSGYQGFAEEHAFEHHAEREWFSFPNETIHLGFIRETG